MSVNQKICKPPKINNYYVHFTVVRGTLSGSDFKKSEPKVAAHLLKSYEIHLR